MFVKPARTPGTPKNGRKWGPRAPQISSDCPRKSLDFELGVGDRLGTLRVSKSKRLFSIKNASQRATTKKAIRSIPLSVEGGDPDRNIFREH